MSQERKKIEVEIDKWDDPESKLKAELGRLSEDESKEALLLTVDAEEGATLFLHQTRRFMRIVTLGCDFELVLL